MADAELETRIRRIMRSLPHPPPPPQGFVDRVRARLNGLLDDESDRHRDRELALSAARPSQRVVVACATSEIATTAIRRPARARFAAVALVGAALAAVLGVGFLTADVAQYSPEIVLPSPPQNRLSVGDVTVVEGDVGAQSGVFSVRLAAPAERPVSVDYSTSSGTAVAPDDYASLTGTLTFAPGQVAKTVAVTTHADRAPEGDETFTLELSAADAVVADSSGLGTVRDNDRPHSLGTLPNAPSAEQHVGAPPQRARGRPRGRSRLRGLAAYLHGRDTAVGRVAGPIVIGGTRTQVCSHRVAWLRGRAA